MLKWNYMIKRDLFDQIIPYLKEKEIILVIGPRQAGKTTLLQMIKQYLEEKQNKTVFFNLDIERDRQFFVSQEALISQIKLHLGSNFGYVFVDEIQRKEDAGLFLKGIYDMNLPIKFIASGSGSLELKEKIHESLTGRKIVFTLDTLSLEEIINFKTNYLYKNNLALFFSTDKIKADQLLQDYLNFGGYPRVVLSDEIEKKRSIINEIFQSYLEKDIVYLLGLKKSDEFINLVKIISSQVGRLVNLTELSSTLGLSVKTVKLYLWYLEKTFILRKLTPFFSNLRKEITKMPIYYFNDMGLRNFSINQFNNMNDLFQSGFVFQNLIANLITDILINTSDSLHFWRTQDKAEVDFIVKTGNNVIPIEVKSRRLNKVEITRALSGFIKKYSPKKAYLINLNFEDKIILGKTELFFIPYWKLITDPGRRGDFLFISNIKYQRSKLS